MLKSKRMMNAYRQAVYLDVLDVLRSPQLKLKQEHQVLLLEGAIFQYVSTKLLETIFEMEKFLSKSKEKVTRLGNEQKLDEYYIS